MSPNFHCFIKIPSFLISFSLLPFLPFSSTFYFLVRCEFIFLLLFLVPFLLSPHPNHPLSSLLSVFLLLCSYFYPCLIPHLLSPPLPILFSFSPFLSFFLLSPPSPPFSNLSLCLFLPFSPLRLVSDVEIR